MRHRAWSTSEVAGRSCRSVEFEKGQRRYDLSPHGDRRLLESGLVCSYEEQVRGVVDSSVDSTFSKGWPQTLQTDQGLEFLNRSVQALLKKHGIHHFSTHNAETKPSVVERFNRTLKTRMWRYFTKHQTWRYSDVLRDLVQSYNNTPHRSIGIAPSQVSYQNQEQV